MKKLYIAFGLFVVAVYAWAGFTGAELRTQRRGMVPQGVRGAHGGYATWHSGYHGGK